MDNGLYFLRVEPSAGGKTENGGVLVLRNGRILGGDAFFYYVGTYQVAGETWQGEFAIKQHTRSELAVPVFGGNDVTVTFQGVRNDTGAEMQATSPGGSYRVSMRRIADA
jgi:hypothetical protein